MTSSRSDSVVSSSAGDSASGGRNGGVRAMTARSSVPARRARVSAGVVPSRRVTFSCGASARESYERMIGLVSRAEERLRKNRKAVFAAARLPQQVPPNDVIAPIVRGS